MPLGPGYRVHGSLIKWVFPLSLRVAKGDRNKLYVLGVFQAALVNNSKGLSCLGLGALLGSLWFLEGALLVQMKKSSAEWLLSLKIAYKLPKDGGSQQFYPSVTPVIHIDDQHGRKVLIVQQWYEHFGSNQHLSNWT